MNITNCAKLWIFAEAFANTTFHGHFENINDFQLLERAFSKTTAKISIENSKLDEIQPLDASLKEIKFSNSNIGEIKRNAFDVLKIDSIIFENCHIGIIRNQALTEKVSVCFVVFVKFSNLYLTSFSFLLIQLLSNHFSLNGCQIGTIETDAISGSGIDQFTFQNNRYIAYSMLYYKN